MAFSLVGSFGDLELDDLNNDLELVDLEHDDLGFFAVLCISSPFLGQLWTLFLNENTFSSMSVNHNSMCSYHLTPSFLG